MTIPITKPVFGDEELRAVQRPIEAGWVVQGPFVAEFEQRFAGFTSLPHAAAASSCTTALHLAVAALDLAPGDEVIVPAFTWVSTANVVEYMHAKPVFCEVSLETFNLDVGQLDSLVTERTVGILPVHLFGLAAEMDGVLEVARRHGLWVVEDAACAFGTSYRGAHVGALGDAGAFSFHPRKSITTGEGGMVTTASAELDRLVRSLRDHGATRSDHERHHESGSFLLSEYPHVGFNYRMTDLQGALGCAQLDRADWILSERRRCARVYDRLLADVDAVRPQVTDAPDEHGYQAYVTLFCPEEASLERVGALHEERNRVMAQLEREGIATRQGTHAPVLQRVYAERYGLRSEDFPNATIADRLTLALPLYPGLTEDEQEHVVARLVAAT